MISPPGMLDTRDIMHPFTGIQITEKGIDVLCNYVDAVRREIGYEVPLAADHFGHMGLESCIRVGKALDQFSLAWYEDMIPWQFTDQYVALSQAVDTPICTGEDIYLKEGFMDLFRKRAVSVDPPRPGHLGRHPGDQKDRRPGPGARHRHGDALCRQPGELYGQRALRRRHREFPGPGKPLGRPPDWSDLVTGLPNPLIQDGYIEVPEKPGLGFDELNEEYIRAHIDPRAARLLRAHRRVGRGAIQRPAVELAPLP